MIQVTFNSSTQLLFDFPPQKKNEDEFNYL